MRGIALLKVFDDAQRMQVVIESAAMASQTLIQRALASMPKGWVANIVDQSKCLCEIFIQPKRSSNRASDLRYLDRVR